MGTDPNADAMANKSETATQQYANLQMSPATFLQSLTLLPHKVSNGKYRIAIGFEPDTNDQTTQLACPPALESEGPRGAGGALGAGALPGDRWP